VDEELVTGVERSVFGGCSRERIDAWLVTHVQARLSTGVASVAFRSGRVSAVYGLALSDGTHVVVKVYRSPADRDRLATTSRCQRVLAGAGYPCPLPLDGPATTEGWTATVESVLDRGEPGDAHRPATRRLLARSLLAQVEILRAVPAGALAANPPAWAAYQGGPWPAPHDPVFDFTTAPAGYLWLDRLAREAADVLGRPGPPEAIGHSDWACQNVRFMGGAISAAYDWDSLIGQSEPVIAGLCAGSYTGGSTAGAAAPEPEEAAAFLNDYDDAKGRRFTEAQQATAAAAATWVLAYNARCDLSSEAFGYAPDAGSPLRVLERHRDAYLRLRW
jgi:hypothetical protein